MKLLPLAVALLLSASSLFGFALQGKSWTKNRTVVMQLSLVYNDDAITFTQSAEDAFNIWNTYLPHLQFRTVRDSIVPRGDGDSENSVFFANKIYDTDFGAQTLAVTLRHFRASGLIEADVIFNNIKPFSEYRGAQRFQTGFPIYDFHRVALHEFGHVLGLDHPDKANPPQTVSAIMNSVSGDTDALQQDDIDGAQALYASGPAYLAAASAPNLVNLSTRSLVGTADHALFAGFIVQGSQPATVILRALGHSLVAFGIPGAVGDPTIELRDANQTILASNDDWVDDPNAQTIASYHLDPIESTESAIVYTLPPGSYTAIVRGFDNNDGKLTGAGIVELYDLHTTGGRAGNISSRAQVFTRDDVLIAGFIVGGGASKPVVVRALGPTLGDFNVTDALVDPTLELRNASGDLLRTNDNWREGPDAALIQSANLAPKYNAESALQITLAPGSYSAVVRGVSDGVGVGLVEVYDLAAPPN